MPKFIFGERMIELPDIPEERGNMVQDLGIDEYHAMGDISKHGFDGAVLSKSQLCDMECPQKFHHKYVLGNKTDDKDHLNIGNAVHTLALEPKLFHDRYYIIPRGIKRDQRTEKYQHCIKQAGNRRMIIESDFGDIQGMAKSLASNKVAMALLEGAGKIEASFFWQDKDTGVNLRTRPDFYRDDQLIVDLKMSHSAEPYKFSKTAFDFHYDISVAMTTEGVKRWSGKEVDNYVFLVVEQKPPYIIEAYDSFRPWDPSDPAKFTYFDAGWFRFRKLLDLYNDCRRHDFWPSYSREIKPMSVPNYAMKQMEGN